MKKVTGLVAVVMLGLIGCGVTENVNPGQPTPTGTPIGTPTPDNTPTATPTPSPSPTPGDLVTNGSFASGVTGWTVAGTPMPATSTATVYGSDSASLLLGEPSSAKGGTAATGDSSASQSITIPSGVTTATLTFWYWVGTSDQLKYSWQEALIQNSSGTTLDTIFQVASNTQTWTEQTTDLSAYIGQTITLYFDVHEDGDSLPSTMFLDDVSVTAQ